METKAHSRWKLPHNYTLTLWKAFLHWIDVLPSRLSESDVHESTHAFELRLWLSLSLQALPGGTGTSWRRQNHDLDQKQRKGLRLWQKERIWQPQKPFRHRNQQRMNSRLTTGAADQQTVTEWQTLCWRWPRSHGANWLVVTRSGFPNPQGLTEELGATPSSKLHSPCGQSESKEEWLYFGRVCVFRHYPVQFENGGVQRKPRL